MPDAIIDGKGSGKTWQIDDNNAGLVTGSVAITNAHIDVDIDVNDFISVQASGAWIATSGQSNVTQVTNPWVVSGQTTVTQETSPWITLGSQQITNIPTHMPGSVYQATDPWIINGSVNVDNTIREISAGSVTLFNSSGNEIASHESADGDYHLGTSMEQNVVADANNSSTDNLDAANSYTFTGTATTTLGVVGLQWSLKTDQNATVYIEESPDGTNWDISYAFDYIASKGGRGETVQASQAYWRIRVVLTGTTDTNYFRLQGVLCPIATPLPSDLSPDGRLKAQSTISGRENTERHVWVNPTNELAVSAVYRMVGTAFDEGTTLDTNFWTDGSLRDGTVAQAGGEVTLETNTTANGLALMSSVRKARFVAGSAQLLSGAVNFVTAGTTNNTRRVGAYTLDGSLDPEDGYYFQMAGTTFSVGHCIGGSCTLVNSGSFNGNLGSSWTPTANTYYKINIEITPLGALWYINGKLLHKVNGHLSETLTLPINIENENTGNSTTDVSFKTLGLYIARQGELETNQTSKFIQGVSTTICKRGAGVVKGIVISDVVDDAEIDFYDGLTTGDTLLWNSGPIKAKTDYAPITVDLFGLPFSDALTIDITTAVCNVLVIYE